jgi:hypothetical protein
MLMLAHDKKLGAKNLSFGLIESRFFVNLSSLPFQRNEVMDGRVQKKSFFQLTFFKKIVIYKIALGLESILFIFELEN